MLPALVALPCWTGVLRKVAFSYQSRDQEAAIAGARIAQSVEHQTFNLRVQGSSPCSGVWPFCFWHTFISGQKGLVSGRVGKGWFVFFFTSYCRGSRPPCLRNQSALPSHPPTPRKVTFLTERREELTERNRGKQLGQRPEHLSRLK